LNFGKRTLVTIIIIPLAILFIYLGGWIYQAVIIGLLALAAWEYMKLLRMIKLQPALPLVLAGVILFAIGRTLVHFAYSSALLTILLFAIAAYHILQFERGETQPAADFGSSISVLLYIGFLGSYLISLRALPNGRWWTFLALPTVWIADTGAYLIGSAFGKHKLAPKTSPNKTWEGYLGGLFFGVLGGIGLMLLYNKSFGAGLEISILEAAGLALILSALIPLGDLTESMIKRNAGQKDSGTIFPGHGGFYDRLDSLFWAAPLAYYLILHSFL
jgi:phosphatidate cytidylyltransferase